MKCLRVCVCVSFCFVPPMLFVDNGLSRIA